MFKYYIMISAALLSAVLFFVDHKKPRDGLKKTRSYRSAALQRRRK